METNGNVKKTNNDIILRFISDRKFRVVRHLGLILLLAAGFLNTRFEFPEPGNTLMKITLFSVLLFLFYINMYGLVPKLLFKDNYLGYFLWLIVLFVLIQGIVFTGKHWVVQNVKPMYERPIGGPNIFAISFIFMILMGASAAVKLFQRWITDTKRINELETNTIQSELEHLKKQINPHFLLNTLNNANVLTQRDPEKASQVLMKLSDLLRYQLYDSARNKVLLTSDIHFLEDFLNLEKIRRDKFDFAITQDGLFTGLEVPPLLFITFIENAVKHNMDAEKPSYIYVFFKYLNGELHFSCINSKPRLKVARNSSGGLGLKNVMRRLELLYPDNHVLTVNDNHETFTIQLKIKI